MFEPPFPSYFVCAECGRRPAGIVELNAFTIIGRDCLVPNAPKPPRMLCIRCSEHSLRMNDAELNAFIESLPKVASWAGS